jgi:hypothetical protein
VLIFCETLPCRILRLRQTERHQCRHQTGMDHFVSGAARPRREPNTPHPRELQWKRNIYPGDTGGFESVRKYRAEKIVLNFSRLKYSSRSWLWALWHCHTAPAAHWLKKHSFFQTMSPFARIPSPRDTLTNRLTGLGHLFSHNPTEKK